MFFLCFSDLLFIFKPLEWISPFHYTYEALVIDQWQNIKHIGKYNVNTSYARNNVTLVKIKQYRPKANMDDLNG